MSKELEALERILNYWVIFDEEKDDCRQIKDILPKSSQIVKTSFKALEIMSKYDLKKSDITRFKTYEEFIKAMYLGIDGKIYGKCPAKEEFDLLKEVLL